MDFILKHSVTLASSNGAVLDTYTGSIDGVKRRVGSWLEVAEDGDTIKVRTNVDEKTANQLTP
jgi:hypothetical protein